MIQQGQGGPESLHFSHPGDADAGGWGLHLGGSEAPNPAKFRVFNIRGSAGGNADGIGTLENCHRSKSSGVYPKETSTQHLGK